MSGLIAERHYLVFQVATRIACEARFQYQRNTRYSNTVICHSEQGGKANQALHGR
jgi:hypothetical protein